MLRKSYLLMTKTRTMMAHKAFSTDLYARTLNGTAPNEFSCCPPEVWMGDAERGRELIRYVDGHKNDQLIALLSPTGFDMLDPRFHGFGWLADLRAEGSVDAQRAAVLLIETWIDHNSRWNAQTWHADLLAERLLRWIGAYAFYMPELDPYQNTRIVASVAQQGRHLKRIVGSNVDDIAGLRSAAGLVGAGVALGNQTSWIAHGLKVLAKYCTRMILADGGPYTRNAGDLPIVLRLLIDTRTLLHGAAVPVPSFLAHAIDRIVPALRFFRMSDHKLTVFHGSSENCPYALEDVLVKSGVTARAPSSLPQTGFEKLVADKTQIIMDCGSVAKHADKIIASPLAFEMTSGDDRIIVNCGQHAHDKRWHDLLSATAAHSTLTLDHADAVVTGAGAHTQCHRFETAQGSILDVTHDGYATRYGVTHTRRLFLSPHGRDLRGEDELKTAMPTLDGVPAIIRFHLHPRTSVALTNNGAEALIRLASGDGWRLLQDGAHLSIEDSIYLGENGLPQKTRQLVLSTRITDDRKIIRWALRGDTALPAPTISVRQAFKQES
jgi:uncharacterized heparinase superfamily protein